MASTSQAKRQKRSHNQDHIEIEDRVGGSFDAIFIPESNDSGDSGDSGSDSESENSPNFIDEIENDPSTAIPKTSYQKILNNYEEDQSKLEPDHNYIWEDGEKKYYEFPKNEILLPGSSREVIRNASNTQLFEFFFSEELKNFIVEATRENNFNMTSNDLDVFLGIIILSIFNERKSLRDYWSLDPLLICNPIAEAMSRNEFLKIKSKIKLSKTQCRDVDDRAWRVRKVLDIFRKNILQFGFFSTALSIDEMMVKFHGRTILQQFIANKPERFGIKMWGICSADGFLFDCDIYCGKGSNIYSANKETKLKKCALGSRVVMQMVQNLLTSVVPKKIIKYHLYFDNFFTNPDLLIHLKNLGLRATGTVRAKRVKVKNDLDQKVERGTFSAKHEKNSGMNFITVMDSKPVSLLSTISGVTPLSTVKRFSRQETASTHLPFPSAFTGYNNDGTKVGSKEVGLEIARNYLAKGGKKNKIAHKSITVKLKKCCEHYHKNAENVYELQRLSMFHLLYARPYQKKIVFGSLAGE
ncbi:piggyBac transposable element-derived protein 3-like [Diprion similis]|uniref:piggyBac transposable element-derived protein 3-like n=1 Tax=Diprion similis TaxID=362088 RepID=UPI001EF84BE8|nr:piggyBac transposable element-derived protein 3-like [Diprion similis]